MSLQLKRTPFGNAENRAVAKGSQGIGSKARHSIEPRGSKALAANPLKSKLATRPGLTNQNDEGVEKRRKSKTPKMSNLSFVGGAYNFQAEFVERQMIRDKFKKIKQPSRKIKQPEALRGDRSAKPDPSPIRRPDPFSASAITKKPSSTCLADNFATASVNRLFKSNNSTVVSTTAASSRLLECDASSDMDTECSTSENTSPLITSPHMKPDPDAVELSVVKKSSSLKATEEEASIARNGNTLGTAKQSATKIEAFKTSPLIASPHTKPDPDVIESPIDKKEMRSLNKVGAKEVTNARNGDAVADKLHDRKIEASKPTKARSRPESHLEQKCVSEEALAQARNRPTDNTLVVAAMLNSCNGKSNKRNDASQTEASGFSLVGSMIGGASLEKSASADESEVTMQDYTSLSHTTHTSKLARGHQSMSTGSIFRKPRTNSIHSCGRDAYRSNVAPSINDLSSGHFIRRPTAEECLRLSNQIGSQLQSGYTNPSQIHLPAGWQVRMSKSKGKPYYVHPDFGSTWHYPGLIIGNHIAVQNELYMDQSIDVSRFTSQGSFMPKSTEASKAMRSTTTTKSSKSAIESSIEHGAIDRTNATIDEKRSFEAQSSEGRRLHKAVGLEKSVNSQSESSDASESKCLTQDSNVNYTESAVLPEAMGERVAIGNGDEVDTANDTKIAIDDDNKVDTIAASKKDSSNNNDLAKYETEDDNLNEFEAENDDCEGFDDDADTDNDDVLSGTVTDKQDGSSSVEFETEQDDIGDLDDDDLGVSKTDVFSSVGTERYHDTSSLASDHVDVDVLLRHDTQGHSSPLVTIKEAMRESSGKQSSQVSLDDGSAKEDLFQVQSSQKSVQLQSRLFIDDLSQVSDDADKLAIKKAHSQSFDDEDDFGSNNINGGGFDGFDHEDSSMLDDNDVSYKTGPAIELKATAKQPRKRRLPPIGKQVRRKTFPPGPLCSLQMLDLIEDGSLNTPMWRGGKRKRCTLTSLKRGMGKSGKIRRKSS